MTSAASPPNIEDELREMNEALLISSVHQHEIAGQALRAEAALRESEKRLAAELAATQALHDISTQLIQEGDVKSLYDHVLDAAVTIMHSDMGSFQILDESCDALQLLAFRGFEPDFGKVFERVYPDTKTSCSVARRTRHRIVVPDIEQCDFIAGTTALEDHRKAGICAVQSTPLISRSGHLLGMISTHWRTRHTPLESELRQFDILARQATDLIERKQGEEVTARLAAIVASSDDSIVGTTLDGIITSWNQGAERLFGYTAEETTGKSISLVIPEDRLDEEPKLLARIRRGESIEHLETVRRRKDGSLVDISLTVSPIKNVKGQIIGASKVARAITERKRAEQALRESESRFRMLADNISQLAWTCDRLGNVTWYNKRWLEYTGLSFEDMKGWNWSKVQHPDHLERVVNSVRRSAEMGEEWEDTFPLRGKDGKYRWFLSRAVPIRDEAGQIVTWFGTNTDVTSQREAEAAVDTARDVAEGANRAKDMFLATLSHEMRTPLSAIVGWMSLLEGGTEGSCTDAEMNEGLDVVKRNARAMVELLDDVMDVSRIVSGKLRLEMRPNELAAIIRAGIDVVRSAADAKGIAITSDLDPAASRSTCDPARIQQVVWNLLSNAIKFTPKGGKIRVTLARNQSNARIQVSDSGPGISPELLPYVFDRFRQADSSTRRKFGGLGLGLSIVRQLVELHGGTVEADSPGEGLGSTFTVNLPIRAVIMGETGDKLEAEDGQQAATTAIPSVRLNGLRVLIVDDEPDARRLLAKVLQQAGANVTAEANAVDALAALPNVNPEILISDLGMPDKDGFDLIREIRAQGYHARDLPAVALSAFIRKEDQRQALLAGFQIYLSKPVDPRDLTATIASLTGRTGAIA